MPSLRHLSTSIAPVAAIVVFALAAAACDVSSPAPGANLRPTTRMAFDTVATQMTSRIRAAWYGDDPDGFVRGYLFSWDRRTWFFTRRTDSVFSLRLGGAEGAFTLSVTAVDNSASSLPPADTTAPVAFVDANGNAQHDDGEEFVGLTGAVDPTPARLTYQIVNSAPTVYFGDDSTTTARRATHLPDTTFTVATVRFRGFDLDGDETIVRFEWSLNDSTPAANWRVLPPTARTLTIRESDGLRAGELNQFFLRAVDAAGAISAVATMPEPGAHWFVRKPRGRILVVRDYTLADGAAAFYNTALETIAGGRFAGAWDVLDIRRGAASGSYGALVPRIIDPMLIETLRLFDAVIWYGDNNPSLTLARLALPAYLRAGGHVLLTTALPAQVEPQGALLDVIPLDSVATYELPNSLPAGIALNPQPLSDAPYPAVARGSGSIFVHPLYPGVTTQPVYRLAASTAVPGEPVVAVRTLDRRVVFFGVQLHKLAEPGASAIVERVLSDFGL